MFTVYLMYIKNLTFTVNSYLWLSLKIMKILLSYYHLWIKNKLTKRSENKANPQDLKNSPLYLVLK